eukprot:TRINITY_DN18139_c0_g1_i1.p1 TRINITY_DN18139_c0_g1~~TRINITY_DN18139_c0_g1_i1.p1  ORF type:complete len:103 (+),score=22.86 TRINITY_DN18139_c0_g1_i1:56-364(+)
MCLQHLQDDCKTCATPSQRMMKCVLDTQLAAEAGNAKKVDQNSLPPPEEVLPGRPGCDIVCDGLKVINVCGLIVINVSLLTDDQGESDYRVFSSPKEVFSPQ